MNIAGWRASHDARRNPTLFVDALGSFYKIRQQLLKLTEPERGRQNDLFLAKAKAIRVCR
jgi:hypothetical protein